LAVLAHSFGSIFFAVNAKIKMWSHAHSFGSLCYMYTLVLG